MVEVCSPSSSRLLQHSLRGTVQCRCGQIRIAVNAPDVLRLVCYCSDCRGYYRTLHRLKNNNAGASSSPARIIKQQHDHDDSDELDPWGGCDYTHLYPSQLEVLQGKDKLAVAVIREGSPIRRAYSECCHAPVFSIGPSQSLLFNTNLLHLVADGADDTAEPLPPPVRFRIMGRQALSNNTEERRPAISWSVPLSWFWTMPGRIRKDLSEPMPLEIPATPNILEGFQRG